MENNLLKTSEMKFESHISMAHEHIKNYSCQCNYILHPYNTAYQIYMYFDFSYKSSISFYYG